MWWLYALLVLVLSLLCARLYIYGNDDYWAQRGIPFVKSAALGSLLDRIRFRIPFHELDHRVYLALKPHRAKFGGIWEIRRPVVYVMDPELIKQVLVKDFDSFANRRAFGARSDKTLFGQMLINLENQEWKDMRAAMSPTFSTGKIRKMFSIFCESSTRMIQFIKTEIQNSDDAGGGFDFRDCAGRFTMDVVASTAFGVDSQTFQDKNSLFSTMGKRFQSQFQGLGILKMFAAILFPTLFQLSGLSILDQKTFQFFSQVTKKTIEHREMTGERREDFLQLLLDARAGALQAEDEEGHEEERGKEAKGKVSAVEWTDEMILAQSLLFFIAGFDTTETLMIYSLYELALNPEVQERLASDLDAVARNAVLTYDTVNQHEYLDMVVSETLRKYPPGPRTERKCTRDFHVHGSGGGIIERDQVVAIPIYGLHHDPEYFPDPERFNPERFRGKERKRQVPYTYLPFGAGPRICIAQRFALMEAKTAIAYLVRAFKIEACSKTDIPIVFGTNGNLKPANGMWLKLSPRT